MSDHEIIDLTGKTAVITGASRGIGAAAAHALAAKGAQVVLAARSFAEIDANARAIQDAGGRALAKSCDVAHFAEVEALMTAAVAAFGSVDILVNNAGIIDPIAPIGQSKPAEWAKVMETNVLGVYHAIRAALPLMETAGSGVIINISSGAATNILEGWSHYCASKAAVLMLTRAVHKEYADKGIRCVGLSPGTVATDMQRVIKASGINPVSALDWDDHIPPDWVGKAIVYLSSDAARDLDGGDFALRPEDAKRRVGLIS